MSRFSRLSFFVFFLLSSVFLPSIGFAEGKTVFNMDNKTLHLLTEKCRTFASDAQQANSDIEYAIREYGSCEENSLYLYTAIVCQEKWQDKITLARKKMHTAMLNLQKYCRPQLERLGVDVNYIPQHLTQAEIDRGNEVLQEENKSKAEQKNKSTLQSLENLQPKNDPYDSGEIY